MFKVEKLSDKAVLTVYGYVGGYYMITGMICFNTLLEVVVYGAAGGAAGYMGKIIISSIHRKIKKLCSK